MSVLQNKIDFVAIISVKNANPNGDPLNGNLPRTTYTGLGEISDVCIKRKIRNRLLDMGEKIFVQSDDKNVDGYQSLRERALANELLVKAEKAKNRDEFKRIACESWLDVRSFGQVFAFKSKKEEKDESGDGVSVGIRGPVSIHPAFSVDPIDITSIQITKSVNNESNDNSKKSSDTMGMKHRVDFGVYVLRGSINVQLAELTGFTEDDAEKIKEAIRTLFVNDSSSARPEGSMEVVKLFWFRHNNKLGQYSSAKVHNSVVITRKQGVETPSSINDYEIKLNPLANLSVEEYEGV
ncbi:type I-C CRISPR-associated protein Cas7/Csd2 [Thermoclostridium caenicola]|uniref:CRISPR-associated protein, Csd2 family n=1 Tax=Thermoclostridium caenicola TaxID=659425 RepID=A0A1M6EJ96_9FIRM|nr:type I-C CRISPR-associated protein Cas7/Csd2 [Thermoclostridium caenicola]SHI85348.1 CRISPR-associated protein, Csd2 family [Thermoclostridium caenicola]